MNIGVIGGAGFIGSHVVDKLIDAGHEVTVFDIMKPQRDDVRHIYIDIVDLSKTTVALTENYDAVYLLAAMGFLMIVDAIFHIKGLAVLIGIVGGTGYYVGAFGAIYLIIMRMTDVKLRGFSSFATFFNLFLLLAIFETGIISMIQIESHFSDMIIFFKGLFTMNFIAVPFPVAIHVLIAVFFVLYLPFTHMTHFVLKYFTYHSIRWNDEPNIRGRKMEEKIAKVLKQPVTWSAKHIGADGKKNWVDIVTSEVPQDEK